MHPGAPGPALRDAFTRGRFPTRPSQALCWGSPGAAAAQEERVTQAGEEGPTALGSAHSKPGVPQPGAASQHAETVPWTRSRRPQEPITLFSPLFQLVILLSNFGGQLGLWMSCSVVCVIEIVEVFFIDSLSIVMRRQWQKAKRWWNHRQQERSGKPPQAGDPERQGHDNPVCMDEDLPTFNTALRLPLPQDSPLPRTPPPNYSTLRLEAAFTEQLPDTLEAGQH